MKMLAEFAKLILSKPWLIFLGAYLVALIGICIPAFGGWQFVPAVLVAFILVFIDNMSHPRWDNLTAIVLGALSVQILFWIP